MSDLSGTDFSRAEVREAILFGANLGDCKFESANLRGSNLEDADVDGALFRGANLEDAQLPWMYCFDVLELPIPPFWGRHR